MVLSFHRTYSMQSELYNILYLLKDEKIYYYYYLSRYSENVTRFRHMLFKINRCYQKCNAFYHSYCLFFLASAAGEHFSLQIVNFGFGLILFIILLMLKKRSLKSEHNVTLTP